MLIVVDCRRGEDAKVLITASCSNKGKDLYYDEIEQGENFKVKFDGDALGEDIRFDWGVNGLNWLGLDRWGKLWRSKK